VIRRLRIIPHMADVPIICVTVVDDREVKYRALEVGATDFLQRPLDPFECAARCKNLLILRTHQIERVEYTRELERSVKTVTAELDFRKMETLHRLAKVAEQRDSDTALHLVRMARYSVVLAKKCGWDAGEAHAMEVAAPLHDIGKIGIPDAILQASRKLTAEEMDVMRKHCVIGFEMLDGSESPPLQLAAEIARSHHEKFDGTGYPRGLKGNQIPLEGRIVAITDVYDALSSVRPYKRAWTVEETTEYLREQSGKHFDPELLDMFFDCTDEIESIRLTFSDANFCGG
jgi:response regulator RpfG family c-di-GMP phosphodiesterase